MECVVCALELSLVMLLVLPENIQSQFDVGTSKNAVDRGVLGHVKSIMVLDNVVNN
jgi:hypothetical protein